MCASVCVVCLRVSYCCGVDVRVYVSVCTSCLCVSYCGVYVRVVSMCLMVCVYVCVSV